MNVVKKCTMVIELTGSDVERLDNFLTAHDRMIELANSIKQREVYSHSKTYDDLREIVKAYRGPAL